MNKFKRIITITAFSLMVLSLPAIASAQWRDHDDDDDYYGRNDRYGNNGRYGNYGYGDMRSTVRSLKRNARELQRHLDNDLDDSRYNGSRREDQLNELARRFRNEVNGLSESNNSNYGRRDGRVERVLNLGSQLDRALSRTRLDHHIEQVWYAIERDLNVLRRYSDYDDRYRTRNGRYGNTRNGLPSWWPF